MFLIWIQFCIYTHINDDFNIYLEDEDLNLEFAQGLLVRLSNTHPIILLMDEWICSCGLGQKLGRRSFRDEEYCYDNYCYCPNIAECRNEEFF